MLLLDLSREVSQQLLDEPHTVTAGEPSLLCNECTARLLALELNAETWGSNGLG